MGRPRKKKQPNRGAKDREKRRFKPRLLRAQPVFHNIRDEPEVEIASVGSNSDRTSYDNAQEPDAQGAWAEMVEVDVDEGEDFEEGVVDAVDEAGVDIDERDGGVFDGDFHGFDEG